MVELMANPVVAVKSTEVQVEITSWTTGVLVFLVVLWALFGPKLGRFHLTEGSAACLFGLLCGGLLLAGSHYIAQQAVVQRLLAFSAASFFTYLLPPVIFYAGLSIEKKLFFSNLGSILALGVVGTTVSALVLAGLLAAGFAGLKLLRVQDCIALGAIFSATDSVATLQVLNQEKQPVLFSLVFGEGVINDATSVVLLGAVSTVFPTGGASAGEAGSGSGSGWEILGGIATTFLYLFATSLALGIATGMAISCLVVRFAAHGPHHEVALIGLLSYLSYLAAEVLGLSGILSLFCCGLTVSQFALDSISLVGRTTTLEAFHTMSYICEGIIFIYLGMDALDPAKWHAAHPGEAITLCGALLLLLVLARMISVLPILGLHNWFHPAKLNSTDMVIICWSGLMRGAVSVALAYFYFDIGSPSGSTGDRHHSTLIVATLALVLTSVLFLGATTEPLMKFLVEDPDMPLSEKLSLGARSMMSSVRSFGSNVKDVAGCCTAAARRGATFAKRVTRDAGETPHSSPLARSAMNGMGNLGTWIKAMRPGLSSSALGFQPVRTDEPSTAEIGNGQIMNNDRAGSADYNKDLEMGNVNGVKTHKDLPISRENSGRDSSTPVTPVHSHSAERAVQGRPQSRGDASRRLRGGALSDSDMMLSAAPLVSMGSKSDDHTPKRQLQLDNSRLITGSEANSSLPDNDSSMQGRGGKPVSRMSRGDIRGGGQLHSRQGKDVKD